MSDRLADFFARRPTGDASQQPVNNFGPLTDEQKALMHRGKVDEALGPFDFMPGGFTALGGAIGGTLGALLPGGLRSIPKMARFNKSYGSTRPVTEAVRDGVSQTAVVGGGTAAASYAKEKLDQFIERSAAEREMLIGGQAAIDRRQGPKEMEAMSGRKLPPYPGPPAYIPKTPEQMRQEYDSTRTGGIRDNRYGIFGGGKLSYDDWVEIMTQYGRDNALRQR